tara:strand:+ start:369 stop:1250 length:882 start_codon:yes stop_codon:yes gene_type:complete
MSVSWKPKTLVLSSAGKKGFVIVGAVSALKKAGYLDNINHIIACSAGSMIAGGIALNYNVEEMVDIMMNMNLKDWNKKVEPTGGIFHAADLHERVKKQSGDVTLKGVFEKSGIRLTFATINLTTAVTEYIDTWSHPDIKLSDAILMSSAVPFVFPCIEYCGSFYCDGGMTDPFPIWKTEDPDYTLGLHMYNNTLSNKVKKGIPAISKGFTGYMDIATNLYLAVIEEYSCSRNYNKFLVFNLNTTTSAELVEQNPAIEVFMFHEGLKQGETSIKILEEWDLMRFEDLLSRELVC